MFEYIALAILIEVIVAVISSIKYKAILSAAKAEIKVKSALMVNLAVKFSTFITPFKAGAFVTKPIATYSLGRIPMSRSTPIIIFEQLFDIGWQVLALPFLLLFIGEAALLNNMVIEFVIIAAVFISIAAAYKKRRYMLSKLWGLKKLMPSKFRRMATKRGITQKKVNTGLEESVEYLSNKRMFFNISVPTLVTIPIAPLALYFCGLAFGVPMGYVEAFLIYWASMIIGRISGIPGGFVSRELSIVAMLGVFGFPLATAAAFSVLYRIVIIIMPIAAGAPIFFYVSGNIAKGMISKKPAAKV